MSRALVYIADPMCSWCWGFAPVLAAVQEATHLPVHVLLGGLASGPSVRSLDPQTTQTIAQHWHHVEEASGQPFDHEALQRRAGTDWRYDSTGPCKAVIALRSQHPAGAHAFLNTLHNAFYAEGRDITDPAVLEELGRAHARDPDRFAADLRDPALTAAALSEFREVRELGVSGFPTLFLRDRADWALATRGWQPAEPLIDGVQAWMLRRDAELAREAAVHGKPAPACATDSPDC